MIQHSPKLPKDLHFLKNILWFFGDDFLFLINSAGKVLWCNRVALSLVGLTWAEVNLKKITDFITPRIGVTDKDFLNKFLKDKNFFE